MRRSPLLFILLVLCAIADAQPSPPAGIRTSFVLRSEREKLRRGLYERTIAQSFSQDPDSSNEHRYESAFWAISQFMVYDSVVEKGFRKTVAAYDHLEDETRRSFLEALYAVRPPGYAQTVEEIMIREQHPKRFSMAALYLLRENRQALALVRQELDKRLIAQPGHPILACLQKDLDTRDRPAPGLPPQLSLFDRQKAQQIKTIYSFQRPNRDYPGLALVQYEDGHFARDEAGNYIAIRQLARSASNLPYYITNGNTPQGIFSIQGTGSSMNNFIGPTPNVQMIMPFEGYWKDYFQADADSLQAMDSYLNILPEDWRAYAPMQEAFEAGRAGRSEIIAHGTTIDPAFFEGRSFYPISPTLGCLCAREAWDENTGNLRESEQYRLVEAFLKTPGDRGYLFVINLGNKKEAVQLSELKPILDRFEQSHR